MKRSDSLYIRMAETLKERFSAPEYQERFIPSEYALQQEFNASRVTVRKALKLLEERGFIRTIQGRGRIAEKSGLAFPLDKNKPRNIACICSCIQLPSYGMVCNTINFTARRSGYAVQVFFTEWQALDRVIPEITPEQFAGIVCVGLVSDAVVDSLQGTGLPVVFIGHDQPRMFDSFCTDDFGGGFMAAGHLHGHGHCAVAVLGELPQGDPAFEQRINGFLAFYRSVGIADVAVVPLPEVGTPSDSFRGRLDGMTGLFILSDLYQPGVNALLRLDRDNFLSRFSIVGYDNFVNNHAAPDFRTDSVVQPWEQLAEHGFQQLKALIEQPGETPHVRLKIRPRLVTNGSVKDI